MIVEGGRKRVTAPAIEREVEDAWESSCRVRCLLGDEKMMRCWTLKSSSTEPRSVRDQDSGSNCGAKAFTAILTMPHAAFNCIHDRIQMNASR